MCNDYGSSSSMRRLYLSLALLLCAGLARGYEDQMLEDDDFAEFEQFDADDDQPAGANNGMC